MVEHTMSGEINDDPRKLSALISRASDLAASHSVSSVLVGMAAEEGDPVFPEWIAFLQAALRVEDGIFRMTRERAVIHLADIASDQAQAVLDRLTSHFCEEFPTSTPPNFHVRLFPVDPESDTLRVKDVLTQIFAPRMLH
jgi:hypothetical protein